MMSHAQYSWISRVISGGSALVFGAGHDSDLWRKHGATIAETSPAWLLPGMILIEVPGRVGQWNAEIHPPSSLQAQYDCVVVDGPPGYDSSQIGRQMTIYWASMLARDVVFVHDYNRAWEKACCAKYLGKPDAVITAKKGHLAIFRRNRPALQLPELTMHVIQENHYEDLAESHHGIMGRTTFPAITAWTQALTWLERHPHAWAKFGAMLVEDDCAASLEQVSELFHSTYRNGSALGACWIGNKYQCPGWVWHWSRKMGNTPDLWKSYNPICYLSPSLLSEVFAYRRDFGRYAFHEILFATLGARMGGTLMDWQLTHAHLFGAYRYRPCVRPHELSQGIAHPVKSQIHQIRHMRVYHASLDAQSASE